MAADTKQTILDTAERLIAEKGIDAVSLRSITSEASVNLAAVHYHFGSKEALVEKVFERRVTPLNSRRLQMLAAAEERAGDDQLEAEDVLRALIAPAMRLYQQEGCEGRRFMQMCGRIYSEQAGYVQRIFDNLFEEVVTRFVAAFRRALPEIPETDRAWRIHFCVGAMIHTMSDSDRLKRFSNGMCDPSDTEATIERMVQFCAAGLRADVTDREAERELVKSETAG
jgi:AcrR family transcriptional regulator